MTFYNGWELMCARVMLVYRAERCFLKKKNICPNNKYTTIYIFYLLFSSHLTFGNHFKKTFQER